MNTIILMSGVGQRFRDAGYKVDKPFIGVSGFPIIHHLANRAFKDSNSIYFICRKDHLKNNFYYKTLKDIAKNDQYIIDIDSHKLGPVHTYLEAYKRLPQMENIVLSYCDYYMSWNFEHYKKYIENTDPDGDIPCYTGFHPHLLPKKNLYASCKVTEDNQLIEIREKFSFEEDKTKALHSPGAYYFKSTQLAHKYFTKAVEEKLELNSEYYISLVYNLLVQDNLSVSVYDKVPYFCQWGTPHDLEEYNFWINAAKDYRI